MRCISLWQPHALLWILSDPEEKIYETRHWYTSHRGPLLVHAAKKQDGEVREYLNCSGFKEALKRHNLTMADVHFGAIIGEVNIIGCCRMDRMPEPSERERSWGNWEPHRYAWERAPNPTIFPNPMPYRGQQGFFDVEGFDPIPMAHYDREEE